MKKIPARCLLHHICSMTTEWNSGVVDEWNNGVMDGVNESTNFFHYSNIPLLQHSKTP